MSLFPVIDLKLTLYKSDPYHTTLFTYVMFDTQNSHLSENVSEQKIFLSNIAWAVKIGTHRIHKNKQTASQN